MSDGFRVYPNRHHLYANAEGYDLSFIEAAHYEREAGFQSGSLTQAPIGGGSMIEHYASKDVPVLAWPVLYCMGCGSDHPCTYTHTIAEGMGVCNLEYVKDKDKYVPSERVSIIAEQSYTGRITRKVEPTKRSKK